MVTFVSDSECAVTAFNDRPGDVRVAGGITPLPDAPRLVVIGRVSTRNLDASTTPKNPAKAREAGGTSVIEIAEQYRPGLVGLKRYSHVMVLCWLDQARRDLIQVTRPNERTPTGVFALRSPVRPNPISLSTSRIIAVDCASGIVTVDALDLIDGTPVVDLKPYRPGIDAIPDAVVP